MAAVSSTTRSLDRSSSHTAPFPAITIPAPTQRALTKGSLRLHTKSDIHESLTSFAHAILSKQSIVCDRLGTWYCENWLFKLFRKLFGFDNTRIMHMTRVFNSCLDESELQDVAFDEESMKKANSFINAGKALLVSIEKCHTEEGRFLRTQLDRRIQALAYRARIEGPESELKEKETEASRNITDEILSKLTPILADWKRKTFCLQGHKLMGTRTVAQIRVLAKYHHLAQLIIQEHQNKEKGITKGTPLTDDLAHWTFVMNGEVNIYAEFPHTVTRLCKSNDSGSLAKYGCYFGDKILRLYSNPADGAAKKSIQISVASEESDRKNATDHQRWFSVQNPNNLVTFPSGAVLTIKKIMRIFGEKDSAWGNLHCFNNGLVEWHAGTMSVITKEGAKPVGIDPAELDVGKFFSQFLPIRHLSLQEMEEKFPKMYLGRGSNNVIVATATRLTETLEAPGTHAYISMYISDGLEGYNMYPFGYYPYEKHFPKTLREKAEFPCKFFQGNWAYPDPNYASGNRQQAGYPVSMNVEETAAFISQFQKEILTGRKNEMAYSMLGNANCANAVVRMLVGFIPHDLFHTQFESAQPPASCVFRLIYKLSDKAKGWILSRFAKKMSRDTKAKNTVTISDKVFVEEASMSNPKYQPWTADNRDRFSLPSAAWSKLEPFEIIPS